MRMSFTSKLVVVLAIFVGLFYMVRAFRHGHNRSANNLSFKNNHILDLELNGVILNGRKFIEALDKYANKEKVRAILIRINSPGGAVGPSQELYSAIKKVRDELKKPVICHSSGLIASGAYYAAMGCSKLVVAPGAMVGSIGVIMEFANLEKLYEWAKVKRYTITSGKFKDSGSEYRAMTSEERALFKDMIDDVYEQFRSTVQTERGMKKEVIRTYADGRVFTGSKAVKLGFADFEGTISDSIKLASEQAGLGDDFELFEIPKERRSFFEMLSGGSEDVDDLNGHASGIAQKLGLTNLMSENSLRALLKLDTLNQPMLLMPGYWGKTDNR